MSERPLVSTITPCFRMRKYLKGFLDHLPQQTYFERMEVVLDHNEPTDEELGWVREFQARFPGRLKHLQIDPVVPIGTSMNRCIRAAEGELLTIWNVDDLRTPDSIESQVRALAQHPDAGICYGNFTVVASFGAKAGRYIDCRRYPASELTRGMIIGPYFMFRRTVLDRAGLFDEQLRQGADFDLAVRLAFHTGTVMADRDLGFYLNEGLGASNRPGTLLPVERTVIELRYGIYDKVDYRQAAAAAQYDIPHVYIDGQPLHVRQFVPDYEETLRARRHRWHKKGLLRSAFRQLIP